MFQTFSNNSKMAGVKSNVLWRVIGSDSRFSDLERSRGAPAQRFQFRRKWLTENGFSLLQAAPRNAVGNAVQHELRVGQAVGAQRLATVPWHGSPLEWPRSVGSPGRPAGMEFSCCALQYAKRNMVGGRGTRLVGEEQDL